MYEWFILGFFTGPAVNMAMIKIDIYRVKYGFSHARVTIDASRNAFVTSSVIDSSAERKPSDVRTSSFLSPFVDSLYRVRNNIMYALSRIMR